MAVEEVVLSVPGDAARPADSEAEAPSPGTTEARVVREYLSSVRARDRFVLGRRMHQRRQERFDLALKTLVKAMATDASRLAPERNLRLQIRRQVYFSGMSLVRTITAEHLIAIRRARRTLRWGLSLAALGAAGVACTIVATGWLII